MMNLIINLIFIFPCILYSWAVTFLIHELMHIKSQGIHAEGTINVHYPHSMTATVKNITRPRLFWFAGGIYSGIIHLLISGMLFYYDAWGMYIPISIFAMMNLCYGFWEGFKGPLGRYKIYAISGIGTLIFWILYYYMVLL